jgi:hypothetical protein
MIVVVVSLGASPPGDPVWPARDLVRTSVIGEAVVMTPTPPRVVAGTRSGDTKPLGDAVLPALGGELLIG